MDSYAIALFVHIVGAVGFFAALGVEWTSLREMRAASDAREVRVWMGIQRGLRKVGFATMLTAVIPGVYMVDARWDGLPWVFATGAALIAVIILTVALTVPRMAAIERAVAAGSAPVAGALHRLMNDPLLWISIHSRVALTLGIVFLKTAKPDVSGSLITIALAILLGVVSALPMARPETGLERTGA